MARAKRHYIPGYVWHTPVKQNKKRFNGVNNPLLPYERISSKIPQRSTQMDRMAIPDKIRYSTLSVLNYIEIQNHRKRKGPIDFGRLMDVLGFENYDNLKETHGKWVDSAIQTDNSGKETKWTQSIAVGSKTYIEKMKEALV